MHRSKFLILLLIAPMLSNPLSAKDKPKDQDVYTETMTEAMLKRLREREKIAYKHYETATTKEDIDRIKHDLQLVVDDYEVLISQASDSADVFLAYGILLHNIGERKAGYAMFVKADKLDPKRALAKNQLGNYMAEEGNYNEALGFYTLAQEIAPKEGLYDYQIANLLQSYRSLLIDDQTFTESELDALMQKSFYTATQKNPSILQYRLRYAQSYFYIAQPDWDEALNEWYELLPMSDIAYDRQLVFLYIARCHIEMENLKAARKALKNVNEPKLQEAKEEVMQMMLPPISEN